MAASSAREGFEHILGSNSTADEEFRRRHFDGLQGYFTDGARADSRPG